MIRLYLKNYRSAELVQLYNALYLARSILSDTFSNPTKDVDELLVYLSGYMDANMDGKGGNVK